jgi:hypothetical protein
MKKYNFKLNGEQRGTIVFDGSDIKIDFIRPIDQVHFMKEVEVLKPKTFEDLVGSGYSMWEIDEVGGDS